MDPHPSVGAVYAEFLPHYGGSAPADILEERFFASFQARSRGDAYRPGADRDFWKQVVIDTVAPFVPEACLNPLFEALYAAFAHADRWCLRPGVRPTLAYLQDKGFRLIVLSNNDHRLHNILDEMELTPRFEHVFVSESLGFAKPDPPFFHHAREALNLPPEQILHVGDNLQADGFGALRAGWKAALLAPTTDPTGQIPTIPNIPALPGFLPSAPP